MIMKNIRLTLWMLLLPFFACCSVQEPAPIDGSVPTGSDKQYPLSLRLRAWIMMKSMTACG